MMVQLWHSAPPNPAHAYAALFPHLIHSLDVHINSCTCSILAKDTALARSSPRESISHESGAARGRADYTMPQRWRHVTALLAAICQAVIHKTTVQWWCTGAIGDVYINGSVVCSGGAS